MTKPTIEPMEPNEFSRHSRIGLGLQHTDYTEQEWARRRLTTLGWTEYVVDITLLITYLFGAVFGTAYISGLNPEHNILDPTTIFFSALWVMLILATLRMAARCINPKIHYEVQILTDEGHIEIIP